MDDTEIFFSYLINLTIKKRRNVNMFKIKYLQKSSFLQIYKK